MEEWEGQFDFGYLPDTYIFNNKVDIDTYSAIDVKQKFRFPVRDPSENLISDTRTDSQKVSDILRVWSQILTPEESSIWSDIAERDVTKNISLKSGLRTPKSMIDNEIKMFKNVSNATRNKMSHLLSKVQDIQFPEIPSVPFNDKQTSLETPLSFDSNNMPNLAHLDTDILANYGSINQFQGLPECSTCPFENVTYQDLSGDCEKQVESLRQQDKYPKRLHLILKSNAPLLYKYMILLKRKELLRRNMSSIFNKLVCKKHISVN